MFKYIILIIILKISMQEIINIYLQNPIGQTFWILWMFWFIFAFIQEDDTKVKKILGFTNIFWLWHFLFMWLYIWVAMVIMSMIRLYFSIKYERDRKIFYIITFVTLLVWILTYTDQSSIFPILASLLATYGFFFLQKVKLRLILLVCSSFWLSFHYLHLSIWWMMTESIIHILHIITIYKILTHSWDMSEYVIRFKNIFSKVPKIDYDRYFAIIKFIKRKNKH